MRTYTIINDNTDERNLLRTYLEKINKKNLVLNIPSDELNRLNNGIMCDVLIIDKRIADSKFFAKNVQLVQPNTIIVLSCSFDSIAQQKSSNTIFGYLPLPITYERVLALNKNIELYLDLIKPENEKRKDYVFIKSEYKLIKVNLKDILYIAGMKDYTQVYLKSKPNPLITLQNLREFETKLPADLFIRVHRSYIISVNEIEIISRNEIYLGKHIIPIGEAFRQSLDNIIALNS